MTSTEALTDIIMSELQREVETLLSDIELEQDSLDQIEGKARAFAKTCGAIAFKAHIQASLEAQAYGYVGSSVELADDKGRAYFERYESRWVSTHLGRFRLRRAYYWNPSRGEGAIPLDEKWDLDEREPSPSLRRSIGMLGAEMPFRRGHRLMLQTALLDLPDKRLQESSEALGQQLKERRQAATKEALPMLRDPNVGVPEVPAMARKGTLYVQMDGGRLNTTTESWREPKLATLYWGHDVVETSKDHRSILNKEHVVVLGDADELAERLWEAACRWEWWTAERVVVLGDGAEWIWNRAQELFPEAIQILDLYHTMEHIWEVARQLYGGVGKQKDKGATGATKKQSAKDRKTGQWARARIAELKLGDIKAIIGNLRQRRPKRAAAREAVEELIGYLDKNRSRVSYAEYREQGLTVGSGTIESGIKNVVNLRMKGCGMRWAVDRAENMLNLRAAYLSDVGPAAQLRTA